MGKVVLLPAPFQPRATFCGLPDPADPRPDLSGWAPERLWLSRACWHRSAHTLMHDMVCGAVEAAVAGGTAAADLQALQSDLLRARRYAPALRVAARILRGPRPCATPVGRDRAACALLLAALRHDDLLAAVELAAEAAGRALMLDAEQDDRPLPPGIRSVEHLAGRMRATGREIVAHRLSWPDMDTIGGHLARALAADPLDRVPGLCRAEHQAEGRAVRVRSSAGDGVASPRLSRCMKIPDWPLLLPQCFSPTKMRDWLHDIPDG